jgi:hypothetical protein
MMAAVCFLYTFETKGYVVNLYVYYSRGAWSVVSRRITPDRYTASPHSPVCLVYYVQCAGESGGDLSGCITETRQAMP